MATPRHHDPLQRALHSLPLAGDDPRIDKEKSDPETRHDETHNSLRRGSPQPRYPPHLRQRRPESCGAHDRPALVSDRIHPRPHAGSDECSPSCPYSAPAAPSRPETHVRLAGSSPRQPVPRHPDLSDCHAAISKEGDEFRGCRTRSPPDSRPLDYKAAVLRDVPAVMHDEHERIDGYFDCYEDEEQEDRSLSAGVAPFQHKTPAFGNSSGATSHDDAGNQFDAEAEHAEQTENVPSFSQTANDNNGHEANTEAGHMVSEGSLHVDCQSWQLDREFSKSSSDESFCNISKEAVEWEYKNECQLAAPSPNQAEDNPQPCPGLIYDYSSVGVSLIEDSCKENQHDNSNNTKEPSLNLEEGNGNQQDVISHDDQIVHSSQHQDIESPPLYLGFNQNNSRFVCCTNKGFRVFDIESMRELFSCMIGGVGVVELVGNSDAVLLVGGGPNPSFPVKNVVMWDAVSGSFTAQVSHKFPIRAVKARFDRLVVVLENEVCVYNVRNVRLLFRVQTISNVKGLCALSLEDRPLVLACLGIKKGQVRIEQITTDGRQGDMLTRKSLTVSAHDSGLACFALNSAGTLLATASDRGTLVRVFRVDTGEPLQEVRRGLDRAEIYSLAFSVASDWLALSSDKGTVHVFGVRMNSSNGMNTNRPSSLGHNTGSTLSFMKGVLPKYFKSEWSYAQFKLPQEMKSVIAFEKENNRILVLCTDGSFYKLVFDSERGGDMKQLEFLKFLKPMEQSIV